jgi:hypothetical protein
MTKTLCSRDRLFAITTLDVDYGLITVPSRRRVVPQE